MCQDTSGNMPELDVTIGLPQLENRLQEKLAGRVHNLQILFHDDGIILRGFARTYHAKQLVQHAVMTESHLPILANDIEVV